MARSKRKHIRKRHLRTVKLKRKNSKRKLVANSQKTNAKDIN
jgi:hypothetical protein